jgi:hypothetical protein
MYMYCTEKQSWKLFCLYKEENINCNHDIALKINTKTDKAFINMQQAYQKHC